MEKNWTKLDFLKGVQYSDWIVRRETPVQSIAWIENSEANTTISKKLPRVLSHSQKSFKRISNKKLREKS